MAELESGNDKAVHHVSKLDSGLVKWSAKISSLKELVGELPFDKGSLSTELLAVELERNKLDDEVFLQRTELERLQIILRATTSFLELLETAWRQRKLYLFGSLRILRNALPKLRRFLTQLYWT